MHSNQRNQLRSALALVAGVTTCLAIACGGEASVNTPATVPTQVTAVSTATANSAAPATTATTAPTSVATASATAGASAATKVSANSASRAQLQAAFQAAGISNPANWAREVEEYRPYPTNDPTFAKLRQNLAKYNPGPGVVDSIIATLSLQ
jgi:hypothetical protein